MANSPFFSGRIPQELFDRVEKYIQETGESKTNVLIKALSAYLNFPIQSNNTGNSNLEKRVQELEQQAIELLNLGKDISEIKQIIESQKQASNSDTKGNDAIKLPPHVPNSDVDNSVINIDNSSEQWNLVGEMSITEILKLPRLEIQDKVKFRDKLKSLNNSRKEKAVTIGCYRFERVSKEQGVNGKVIYRVSDNSVN